MKTVVIMWVASFAALIASAFAPPLFMFAIAAFAITTAMCAEAFTDPHKKKEKP